MDFEEFIRTFTDEENAKFDQGNWDKGWHQLTELYQLYSAGIKQVRTKLEILDSEFLLKHAHDPIHHIEFRLKSPKSIMQKLTIKQLPFTPENVWEHVSDVAGIRVICSYIEDIYRISNLLLAQNDINLVRKKDYHHFPKSSGYRSLHLVISIPVYLSESIRHVKVEVQLRTIAMDFWATLEHQIKYKSGLDVSSKIRHELRDCSDSIAVLDQRMQAIHQAILGNKDINNFNT